MPRQIIQADLKGLRMMWIPGWRLRVLWAWLEAYDNYPVKEWFEERPWKNRR